MMENDVFRVNPFHTKVVIFVFQENTLHNDTSPELILYNQTLLNHNIVMNKTIRLCFRPPLLQKSSSKIPQIDSLPRQQEDYLNLNGPSVVIESERRLTANTVVTRNSGATR